MLSFGRPDQHKRSVALEAGEGLLTRQRRRRQHDRCVCAPDRLDLRRRIMSGRVHGVVGAEVFGDVELGFEDVDGGNGCAGDLGVLHGQVAESADSEHGHEVRRTGARHLDRLVRGDTGARQRSGVERVDPGRYEAHERGVGEDVLGEAAVDGVAGVAGVGAQRLPSRRAGFARSACPPEPRNSHTVAFVQGG